ncbi:hypothetical protein MLD38_005168 [Melastoma candidum]|uniref:Uncharacterized protein n=1 Tax=Melastoma candidum TaxID=119954 RepID=A0ACB9S7W5_9MYRT|nr:hypothetical protein MLD38_005168 [Melastoma candidum]
METKLIGFEYLKDLYKSDEDFGGVFTQCTTQVIDQFHQVNGFLFRDSKLCIPRSSTRELLIREVHEGGIAGHLGVDKTLSMLQENFYWPQMEKQVRSLISRCAIWHQAKSRVQPQGLYTPLQVPERPWEHTAGQTEVVNRTMATILRTLVSKNHKYWDVKLAHAEFAYNRAPSSTTKSSPFEVVYGHNAIIHVDLMPLPSVKIVSRHAEERTMEMRLLHEKIRA